MKRSTKTISIIFLFFLIITIVIVGRSMIENHFKKKFSKIPPPGIIVTKVVRKEFSEKIDTFGTAISKKSESFCFNTMDRKAPSAVGERQILPMQTNKTLTSALPLLIAIRGGSTGCIRRRILTHRRVCGPIRPVGNGDLYMYLNSHSFDRIRAMSRLLPTLLLLAALLMPDDVAAHGSVTPEDDLCIMRIGYYQAHFKIYLPVTRGHKEYCEDIPDTGETIFIMEYEHSGLADVPIDFRIIRNTTGQGIFTALEDVQAIDDLESVTVIHHDAAIQRDVFTIMYDFQEQGEFVGIVNVRNPDTGKVYTAVFPFEVGPFEPLR
mgnify:CR=1 FL=1